MMASKNKDREVQSHAVGALSNLRAIAIQILIALTARIACFLGSMSVFVVFVEGKFAQSFGVRTDRFVFARRRISATIEYAIAVSARVKADISRRFVQASSPCDGFNSSPFTVSWIPHQPPLRHCERSVAIQSSSVTATFWIAAVASLPRNDGGRRHPACRRAALLPDGYEKQGQPFDRLRERAFAAITQLRAPILYGGALQHRRYQSQRSSSPSWLAQARP